MWEGAWARPAALQVFNSPEPGEGAWYTARLYRIDLDSGAAELLFTPEQQLGWPAATASGERWAFVTATCSDRWIVAGDLHIATEAGDDTVVDTAGVDVTWVQWFDEQRLGYFGLRGLTTVAGIYDVAAGKAGETWTSATLTCGDRLPRRAASWPDEIGRGRAAGLHPLPRARVRRRRRAGAGGVPAAPGRGLCQQRGRHDRAGHEARPRTAFRSRDCYASPARPAPIR